MSANATPSFGRLGDAILANFAATPTAQALRDGRTTRGELFAVGLHRGPVADVPPPPAPATPVPAVTTPRSHPRPTWFRPVRDRDDGDGDEECESLHEVAQRVYRVARPFLGRATRFTSEDVLHLAGLSVVRAWPAGAGDSYSHLEIRDRHDRLIGRTTDTDHWFRCLLDGWLQPHDDGPVWH